MTRAVELAQVAALGVSEAFKNRIINGAMVISQRNGTSTVATPTDGQFVLDRFNNFTNGGGVYSVGQSTVAPDGFSNSSLYTVTTADASIAATDYYLFVQPIEGYNCSDLGYGTANAKTVTVSFWVRSSVTGTFGFGLRQQSGSRSYVGQYTVNAANTWEQKSITIVGDTAGSIANNNDTGLLVTWDLGAGSNRNGTANTWQAGNFWRASGNTNLIATNGATFYITGVQLEVGSTATSFDYRPYGTELFLCQRYYQQYSGGLAFYARASTVADGPMRFCATMRTAPSMTQSGNARLDPITGAAITPSSVSVGIFGTTADGTMITTDNYSGLTSYKQYFLLETNVLKFSAEL
jgi:hypothetical protein